MSRFRSIGVGAALSIELVGVVLLTVCSQVDPPFTSSREGRVTHVTWGTNCSGCSEDYVEVDGRVFRLDGTQPAGPGPYGGETVLVTYQDVTQGWSVLSVTTSPGLPGSVTYTTSNYRAYVEYGWWLGYLAIAGLVAGALLALPGAIMLVLIGRRARTAASALGVAFAPVCLLGGVPLLLPFASWSDGAAITPFITTVLRLLSALGLAASAITSRALHERLTVLSRRAMVGGGVVNALWAVCWIGVIWYALSHFD